MSTTQTTVTMDLGPQPTRVCVTREDSTPMSFRMRDSAGNDITITGRTYLMTVSTDEEPSDTANQVFQLTGVVATPIVTFTPTQVDLDIDPDVDYFFDIQETNGAAVRTVAKGQFVVGHQITQ